MSAGKHTPGPWAAEIARVVPESEPFGFFIRHAERRRSVVNCNVYETATPVLPVEWRDATITLTDWKGHHYTPDELVANAHLIAAAPDLLAALQWCEQFELRDGEDANERFERIADAFHKATGYLRPGKSASMESGVSYEERQTAWDEWMKEGRAQVRAALSAATGLPQP